MRISTVLSLLSIVALAACGGGQKTTYTTANGTATVTKNGSTTTYESKEGKLTAGQGAVDVSKLGAPLYPGAAQNQDNSSISVTTSSGSSTMASFSTNDQFPAVYAWYKAHLPKGSEKMNVSQGGSSIAEFVTAENTPNQTLVMITGKDNQTAIVITHGK
jgi:ABC-type enterochelin transport system substrate-binding protein